VQGESHLLKKILLFYWEVIEKTNANGTLKDEMILVCNSLRNDLLHPNEYIRGRTLKLLSRIQLRVWTTMIFVRASWSRSSQLSLRT
jgi:coatomer subunit beta